MTGNASPHSPGRRAKKGVLVGPQGKSGLNMGRDELKARVQELIARYFPSGSSHDVSFEVHMTRSLAELGRMKVKLMRRESPPDFIVLLGGDGNTHLTLGQDPEFLEYLTTDPDSAPEVIVLKAGSKNVVPNALGLLGEDPLRAFEVICQKLVRGIPRNIVCCPILKINDRHGFIYGSGLVVSALDAYYQHSAGPARALKTGFGVGWRQTFGQLNPWKRPSVFRRFGASASWRDSGGTDHPVGMERFNAFIVSSLTEVNPWLKVTYRTGERLGCFHAVCHNNGFLRSALNLPSMIVGAPLVGDVRDAVTDRLIIRYAESMRHTIDGEIYTTEELGLANVPGADPHTVVIETGPYIKFVVS